MDTEEYAEMRRTLDALNAAVKEAIAKRTAWLDENMWRVAKFKVGDSIYNVNTGKKLGVVTEIKRHWAGDGNYDDSLDVFYEYRIPGSGNFYDNTSRQLDVSFGTADEAAEEARRKAEWARDLAASGGDEDAAMKAEWARILAELK